MAIRIWSEEARAFVEPEDILACGADGVYYSVPQINAPAADGTWGQVWPERVYLYKEGNKCETVTGGWTDFRTRNAANKQAVYPVATFAVDYIQFSGTDNILGWGSKGTFTNKTIEISKYTKLCMEVVAACTNIYASSVIGLATQNEIWGTEDNPKGNIISKSDIDLVRNLTNYTVEIDISSYEQAYIYVKGYGRLNTVKIYNVWLEQ